MNLTVEYPDGGSPGPVDLSQTNAEVRQDPPDSLAFSGSAADDLVLGGSIILTVGIILVAFTGWGKRLVVRLRSRGE